MKRPPWPHMMPRDLPLWAGFLLSPLSKPFAKYEYDVHVGVGCDPGPAYEPSLRKMAITLTQLRMDAIGWDQQTPTIFEVKPDARLSAFGQVLAYCYYYHKQFGVRCRRGVVTDTMTPDVAELSRAHDVDSYLGAPASPDGLLEAARRSCPGCALTLRDILPLYETPPDA